MKPDVLLIDTTLRDGSHAVAHQYTLEDMKLIAQGLEKSGVKYIEVGHGDGLGGSSIQYGFSKEEEQDALSSVKSVLNKAKLAVLLLPGIGTYEDLMRAKSIGASMVRVATHSTEADISQQYIELSKKEGMEVIGFLMMAHMVDSEKLAEQAKLMEKYGADAVYVTDSAGALLPVEVEERVNRLKNVLNIPIGFHAHNNLGLAVGNSIAAINAGALYIDGTISGMGAGAGNAPIEVLVAVFDKMGLTTDIDLYSILDVTEQLKHNNSIKYATLNRNSISLGYAGVYSSFLLHAERAARKFKIDVRDILIELGRRRTVGGQEDTIIDVAYELATQNNIDNS